VVDVRPSAEALILPEGYGTVRRTLAWPTVRERLEQALHYWVATTRIDGRPHVVPRWGVWVDDAWYYDGSPATVHARNLERNAAAVLHLEDGAEILTQPDRGQISERIVTHRPGAAEGRSLSLTRVGGQSGELRRHRPRRRACVTRRP
jgi:hypothetical protein